MGGKLLSGVLLTLPTPPRHLLFGAAPACYCLSHALLLTVDVTTLASHGLIGSLAIAQHTPRLMVYSLTVGLSFGLIFGTLQCLPARLFGRRALPALQSATYAAVIHEDQTGGPG